MLPDAGLVLTTLEGAERLGANAVGLVPWQQIELRTPAGATLTVTATPARHGPANADRGPVIGFALALADEPEQVVYCSGDTVWFDGIAAVAQRFDVRTAILNLGAARVRAAGDRPLTLTADEAVTVARAMPRATIVPLHFEGWEHFSESRADVERAFHVARATSRLWWPPPGTTIDLLTRAA